MPTLTRTVRSASQSLMGAKFVRGGLHRHAAQPGGTGQAALAGTLVLRGLALWLPLLPGVALARCMVARRVMKRAPSVTSRSALVRPAPSVCGSLERRAWQSEMDR